MIYEKLLDFKAEVVNKGGEVVCISLDKEGYRQLANELTVPFRDKLLGVVIEKECPTSGQSIMAIAVICPICSGTGKIVTNKDLTMPTEKSCHGCGGKGWVSVGSDAEVGRVWPDYPSNPAPWPYYYTYPPTTWTVCSSMG